MSGHGIAFFNRGVRIILGCTARKYVEKNLSMGIREKLLDIKRAMNVSGERGD